MTRPPLQHAYPQMLPPDDEPSAMLDDYRETWTGTMRLVRSRKRRRTLQRRGVPMMDLRARNADGYHGPKAWAWFVEPAVTA